MSSTLDLARDYSHFIITFFDLISTSAPHIYISSLLLSPETSMVHEVYKHYACPLSRVIYGLPTSWDPVVAVAYLGSLDYTATWSPCNGFVAVARFGAVEICDAVTLNPLNTFKSDSEALWLSFSPDSRLLTQFNHSNLITWDLQTGGSVGTIFPEGLHVDDRDCSSTYSMDGKMLAVVYLDQNSNNTFIATHNLFSTHTHFHKVLDGRIICPIWTHGKFLRFSTIKPGHITIWEVPFTLAPKPEVVKSLPAPEEITDTNVFRLSLFLPSCSWLATSLHQDMLLVWDAQNSKLLLKISCPYPDGMSFSSDGHFFACIAGQKREVHVWKESPAGYILHQKLEFCSLREDPGPILSPSGELILVPFPRTIYLWHTKDLILSGDSTPIMGQTPFILEFSPDEVLAAFVRNRGKTVTVLNLQSGNPQLMIDTDIEVRCLGVTGNTIATIGRENIVTWDLATRNTRVDTNNSVQSASFDLSPPSCGRPFTYIRMSPDLSHIATSGFIPELLSVSLEIYDVSTGRCLAGTTSSKGKLKLYSLLFNSRLLT